MERIKIKLHDFKDELINKISKFKSKMKNKVSYYKYEMKNKISNFKDETQNRISAIIKNIIEKIKPKPKDYPYGIKPISIFEWFPVLTLPIIRQLLFYIRLFCWVIYDIAKNIIQGRDNKIHLYGIWCFVGMPGAGKTMS